MNLYFLSTNWIAGSLVRGSIERRQELADKAVRAPRRKSLLIAVFAATLFALASGNCAENLLLTGATVHTVTGESLSPGQVHIQDGKIIAVAARVTARGAKTVDLKGLHLYPGLIALNTALGLTEISAVRATRDTTEVGDYTPDVESWIAVNPDSELLPVARGNGITHFQPVPQGGVVSGQSALMVLDGWTYEDMIVRKPVALHVFWPRMDLDTTPKERLRDRSRWKSLEDQARERREKLQALDDFFAEASAYAKAKTATTNAVAGRVPAWESMLPFVRGDLPLVVHADELRQIHAAVHWANTNKFKIILAGGRDAWKVAGLLATNNFPVLYEHVFTLPARDTDGYDVHFKAPYELQKAGVKVVFSQGLAADGATLVKNLPYAAAQAAAFGLPREEALKGITLYPAQVMGVAERLGSIEAGKEATIFVADGDILDIRSNVKRMWIAGNEVRLDSRHTRLYEKYKSRPKR